jgi:GTP cyclohydrolase I
MLVNLENLKLKKYVRCKLCKKKFERITNTHLRYMHGISSRKYKKKFPGAKLDCEYLEYIRGIATRGKSYEQQFGKKKARQLMEKRKQDAILQFKDPKQREMRREEYTGYRKRALKHYGYVCERCGITKKDLHRREFHVHHRDGVNISTELGNNAIENLAVLCNVCHRKLHAEQDKAKAKFFGIRNIEKGVHYIFKGLKQAFKLNLKDENFKATPKRVARAYAEIFEGVKDTDGQVKDILMEGFPCTNSQMILSKNIRAFSMCPHHLLPVDYHVTVAYIPSKSKGGRVLGLSKLSRLVTILARRPVIQERFTQDVTQALMTLKGCKGAGCIVTGRHYCMIMRGVNQPDSFVETSSLDGIFKTNPTVRAEFLSLAKDKSVVGTTINL